MYTSQKIMIEGRLLVRYSPLANVVVGWMPKLQSILVLFMIKAKYMIATHACKKNILVEDFSVS